ncbi:MAG: DNA cytosine methyltransferase, partial [Bifidobacteriaceae bacterium]|nr:DNA cytosine methyltransferase [Bifidobacteriaceae bacterium]
MDQIGDAARPAAKDAQQSGRDPAAAGRPLRLGSLFSGMGGLDLAVEEVLGARAVWFCENDPAAAEAYAAHWPGVPNLGDIGQVDWAAVPPVDALCGGFPCTDLSVAGERRGLAGQHSGLWRFMAAAVGALRPKWVFVENVPGALSAPSGVAGTGQAATPGGREGGRDDGQRNGEACAGGATVRGVGPGQGVLGEWPPGPGRAA